MTTREAAQQLDRLFWLTSPEGFRISVRVLDIKNQFGIDRAVVEGDRLDGTLRTTTVDFSRLTLQRGA